MYKIYILICGSRAYADYDLIFDKLKKYRNMRDVLLISGDCSGADKLALRASNSLNIDSVEFKAYWDIYGRAAGPIRNKEMVDLLASGRKSVKLYAFVTNHLKIGAGTNSTIKIAKSQNIKAKII